MITQHVPSFNSGELSPLILQRSDLVQYRSGCSTLQNMLITPYGGVRRRSGLEFLGNAKGALRPRLVPFQYSTDVRYMLELGENYLRLWNADGDLVTTTGVVVPAPDPDNPPYFERDFYLLQGGVLYRCVEAHEATDFATDLADGKWILWPTGILEFYTPYLLGDLRDVQLAQVNAEMRMVHPDHWPQVFRWETGGPSYFREITWKYPALLDENTVEDITIEVDFPLDGAAVPWDDTPPVPYLVGDRVTYDSKTWRCERRHTSAAGREPGVGTYQKTVQAPDGNFSLVSAPLWIQSFSDTSASPGQTVDLTATAPIFDELHVGAYWEVSKQREKGSFQVKISGKDAFDGTSSEPIVIQGRWQVSTYGVWDGTFTLERSKDRGATWQDVRDWESTNDRNVGPENTSATGIEPDRCLMRLRWDKTAGATESAGKPRAILEAVDGFIRGVVRILTVDPDGLEATAEVIKPVEKCITRYWAEGAWSDYRGFPRTLTAHEQRILYGGTRSRSQSVWGSAIDDYENFQRETTDTASWVHSLAADQQNAIQWMLSQKQLLIGTSGGEWVMASRKEDTPITFENIFLRRHSGHGSDHIAATLVNEATLFVQRGGRKLREMVFSFEADGYVTQDLTILAEHITDGGILETAFQQQRDAILWAVTGNGKLIGMTYERGQKIAGWARHETTGTIGSVAVLSTDGEHDEVWLAVNRPIGHTDQWLIERMKPDDFRSFEAPDLTELFFVDSGVRQVSESPVSIIEGLDHLEGRTVALVADGSPLTSRVVIDGTVSLGLPSDPEDATVLVAGLPYTSILEPTPFEFAMQNGTSVSRKKRIHEVAISFHQSAACLAGATKEGDFDTITHRRVGEPFGQPTPLYTGPYNHKLNGRHGLEGSLVIKQEQPLPLTVLAIVPKLTIHGDDD